MARELVQARAVVLRSVDYGERDMILTLLMEGLGKRSAIAKGGKSSKRRFPGALENFRVSRFTFTDRGPSRMAMLAEARVVEDFPGIEGSFEKISAAAYATELVRELIQDGEGGQRLFAATTAHYRQLNTCEDAVAQIEADLGTFVLRVLSLAGFEPSLRHCFRCGSLVSDARAWRFMLSGQGAICTGCRREGERTLETTRDVLMTMDRLAGGYAEQMPEVGLLREMRPMMQDMVKSALGKDLKSSAFLKMVLT